jgi:alkylation response protein AidB-like acyl-CoA dehydrogenase
MVTPRADLERDIRQRVVALLKGCDPTGVGREEFLRAKFDAGLAWVHFPLDAGGLDLDHTLQAFVEEELGHAGAPSVSFMSNPIGLGMAAPTLAAHGTSEQRRHLLRRLYAGELWCQLFSEPNAGSDLAGLGTTAVRDGYEWIVNGQKVWTTLAHVARWGLLLARSAPELPKHRGLTYFICDMGAAGVEVRPLRQMTGEAEFNEVYLSDVRIPDDHRIGAVGDGWRVAMTTLMSERVAIGTAGVDDLAAGPIARAMEVYAQRRENPVARDRLIRLWIESEVTRLTNCRASELRRTGKPGPEGSVAKLAFTELNKRIAEFCVDVLGADGLLYPAGYQMRRPEVAAASGGDHGHSFLRAQANSIEGGTSEVLRNVLGERVLGLANEPRRDKDVPWSDLPR